MHITNTPHRRFKLHTDEYFQSPGFESFGTNVRRHSWRTSLHSRFSLSASGAVHCVLHAGMRRLGSSCCQNSFNVSGRTHQPLCGSSPLDILGLSVDSGCRAATLDNVTDKTEKLGFDNSLQCKTCNAAVTLAGEIACSVNFPVKCLIGRETLFSDLSKTKTTRDYLK